MLQKKIVQRLRALLQLSKNYRGRLMAATALMLLGSLAALFLPLLTGRFIDALAIDDPTMTVAEVAACMISAMALQGLLTLIGSLIIAYADEHVLSDLRIRAFNHLHRLPTSFFGDRKHGELISRIAGDVEHVSSAGPANVVAIMQAFVTIAGTAAFMFVISPRLLLWASAGIPLLLPLVFFFGRKAYGLSQTAQDQEAEICGYIADNIRNNTLLKGFNAIESEEHRFAHVVKKAFKTALRYNLLTTLYRPATAIVTFSATLIVLGLGSQQVKNGILQPGDIVAFLLFIGMMMAGFSHLASCSMTLVSAAGSASRLFEILDLPTEPTGGPVLPDIAGGIDIADLTFKYESATNPTLANFNLSVKPGETIAVTGPSGSGKTTLLKLICALYTADSGTIKLGGHASTSYCPNSIRQQIAYLEQEPHLIYGSVRQNLIIGSPGATQGEITNATTAAQAHEFITNLPEGYETRIGEDGVKLSTGQRHRISLARALLKSAPILLLDEPGTALDRHTEDHLKKSLGAAIADRTCIIVAHTSELLDLADRTISL